MAVYYSPEPGWFRFMFGNRGTPLPVPPTSCILGRDIIMTWNARAALAAVIVMLACGLALSGAFAQEPMLRDTLRSRPADDGSEALDRYLEREDPSYGWEVRREGEVIGAGFTELRLVSQTWRGIEWRHQLFVIWPTTADPDTDHALLHIDSGTWDPRLDDLGFEPDLPSQAQLFAAIAELLGTPFAVLRQVPFQPLFDGLVEDALVSYTFQRYIETGEADWPLLLPMVKSAVRGMDAVQELALESRGMGIEGFTVSGASKRGWTTWLTGAADERVRAIVPMVIDVLEMESHLEHQLAAWGEYSPQIMDYIDRGIHQALDTERGRELLAIVDPYRYRERIEIPKLLVIGTNDPYWPLDALNLYWDGLVGPKRVLYLPNAGHRADDYPRVVGSLTAMHRWVAEGEPALPEPVWEFHEHHETVELRVRSDVEPREVAVWSATAPTRDFREAAWSSRPCAPFERGGGAGSEAGAREDPGATRDPDGTPQWVCEIERPREGYAALFAELTYPGVWVLPLHLSTQVRIVEARPGS
jgi:PhoPQ-activated pathogenicity-related protein